MLLRVLIIIVLLLLLPGQASAAAYVDPQYIFVRIADHTKPMNMDMINEVFGKIGTKGASLRKVGIGLMFFYNQEDMGVIKSRLQTGLDYSRVHDVPVFLVLDGFEWWEKRTDLWNWWDQNMNGYSVANKNNVEWTCWENSCAVDKTWRNWGAEYQMRPHPNIMSQAFIAANTAGLRELLPIIHTWYKELPDEKKYLLGGISTSMEQDIGANYYYYPNGIKTAAGLKGTVQLGYAAVRTAGLKSSGTITDADIDTVIQRYQKVLNKIAIETGIPRNKIFNHNGGKGAAPFIEYPPGVAFATLNASLNEYALPGWSFYGDVTANPHKYPVLQNTLTAVANSEWASPEWLPFAADYTGWMASLRGTLSHRNNRFVNVANWESIRDQKYATDAIRTVANENPACWVTSPWITALSTTSNAVTFTWQPAGNAGATYLVVSTKPEFKISGELSGNLIVNESVGASTSKTIPNLSPGTYYIQLVADGCAGQRRISNRSFVIQPAAPQPGDVTGDGHVNQADADKIRNAFGNPYTIYDYNAMIGNWGK